MFKTLVAIGILCSFFINLRSVSAQEAVPVECGDIINGAFTEFGLGFIYTISLRAGDSISLEAGRVGNYLLMDLELLTPSGTTLEVSDKSNDNSVDLFSDGTMRTYGDGRENPSLTADGVPISGQYTILFASSRDSQNAIGEFTLFIRCALSEPNPPTLQPTQVSSAQTIEPSPVTFTLYRDEESISFYFSGASEIPFHSIRIDVFLPNGDVEEIYLQDYSTFERLLIRSPLQAPTCLRLELRDSDVPFPDDCRVLTSQQRRVENNIGRSGIFWYDDEINEYFALELYQQDVFIGDCAADLVEDESCEITFVPQPMPEYIPPTPRPTVTAAPQLSVATPTVAMRSYPCNAQVDPNSPSSILNVVRQSPNSTTVIGSVRRAEQVVIIERSAGTNVFYRIQSNGRTIGWIAAQYLVLSPICPS